MVTWGANTVHTIAGSSPAPAAFSFGSAPAPATGSAFGGSASAATPSAFGSPAPAAGGGLFGTPAPAPSGGLFGSAAGGGLFGSSTTGTAPASGGGLFGSAPAPSAFGGFGQTAFASSTANPQQQQQYTQIPAQAAMQAHLDATARQEETRVMQKLEHIQRSYTGAEVASNDNSASFATILYNPLTREVHQQQWLQGVALDGQPKPINLPCPAQLSEQEWNQALVRNPDYLHYMPIAIVGAEALQARLNYQQELSNTCDTHLSTISESQTALRKRCNEAQLQLEHLLHRQNTLKSKLMAVLRKVELARCFNLPLQRDEMEAAQQIMHLIEQVQQLYQMVKTMTETIELAPPTSLRTSQRQNDGTETEEQREARKQLLPMVQSHRNQLLEMFDLVKRDGRDLSLIQERVEQLRPVRSLHG